MSGLVEDTVSAEVVGVQGLPQMYRAALWVRGWGWGQVGGISRGNGWVNWRWVFQPPTDPCRLAGEAEWVFTHIWRIGDAPVTAETHEGSWGGSTSQT